MNSYMTQNGICLDTGCPAPAERPETTREEDVS